MIPPELADGAAATAASFTSNVLNNLYRRMIGYRDDRPRAAPRPRRAQYIVDDEKQMLQEAVDALFDSDGRRGRAF